MRLSKWQGLGNDYIIVDESALAAELTPAAIGLLCDRHLGVGGDGVLVNCMPSGAVDGAVARMRVFNPDGSEPEMCGNGIRMFARYLSSRGMVEGKQFVVETLAGAITPCLVGQYGVRVDMGLARFMSEAVSAEAAALARGAGENGATGEVIDSEIKVGRRAYRFSFVDVGNPHCVIPVDDPDEVDIEKIGSEVERHPFFPNRANVEFVAMESDGSVRMRVWERGVGETQACGTGATAVGAAYVRQGLATSPVLVHLLGGDLTIEAEPAEHPEYPGSLRVHMSGPAEESFTGELAVDLLERLGWS